MFLEHVPRQISSCLSDLTNVIFMLRSVILDGPAGAILDLSLEVMFQGVASLSLDDSSSERLVMFHNLVDTTQMLAADSVASAEAL